MLQDLIHLHQELVESLDLKRKRFLYEQIHWESQAVCVFGARGVGKTTLLCQRLKEAYGNVERALYISADNIHVQSEGLLNLATQYFALGGEALFIDEVHKYPNWAIEIKNIIDSFKKKKIVISGSSAMDLHEGKGDLSRRVVYYELPGMSFREYLEFTSHITIPAVTLEQVLQDHVSMTKQFSGIPILKFFGNYLQHGYYPYFLESPEVYYLKLNNVIEKVIAEDIALSKKLKPGSIFLLKKLLWLVATSTCLTPNIDNISKELNVTRDSVYSGFSYLEQGGLIRNIFPGTTGMRLIRKPAKIYLENTNLLQAISGTLSLEGDTGSIRETFFANQLSVGHTVQSHNKGDFTLDQKYVVEVGGRNKKTVQLEGVENSFFAIDGIPVGFGKRIPLYLFGLLY
jgi:predicted AAA+ superfamily ATPase